MTMWVVALIPAFNEAETIARVVAVRASPSASEKMATAAKPGLFSNWRRANFIGVVTRVE